MRRWAGLLLFGMLSGSVQAETLNLDQAVERALQADPRIKEREQLVAVARTLLQEADGAGDLVYNANTFLSLTTSVDGGFYQDGAETCTGTCRPRTDNNDFDRISPWAGLTFSIIKPLYTFGKIENYAEAAKGNIEVKQADVTLRRGQTILDVTQAYYGYLTARDSRLVLEDVRERLQGAAGILRRWLDEGTEEARQSDQFALDTAIGVVNGYIAQAQGLEAVALDGLKVLTGIGLEGELTVADERIAPVARPVVPLPALQERALTDRPEAAQVEAGLRARRALVEARKSEQRPNVYAGIAGSLAYAPARDQLNNPHVYDPFNHEAAAPVVGLQWSYDGRMPARVARAQAELDVLVETAAFARMGIPFQVASAHHQVVAFQQRVQSLEGASRAGRRWMISTYADFEAGLQDSDDVIKAFQGYVLAHTEYLRAVNDYNNEVARLRYVTGELK